MEKTRRSLKRPFLVPPNLAARSCCRSKARAYDRSRSGTVLTTQVPFREVSNRCFGKPAARGPARSEGFLAGGNPFNPPRAPPGTL